LLVLSAIADLLPARDGAGDLLRKAKKAEKAGRVAQAYLLYAEAAALDPAGQTRAWAKSLALRRRALTEIKAMPKDLDRGDEEAGSSALLGVISPEELEEARHPLPPVTLRASRAIRSFDLRGDARRLYEQVAGAYGLTVVFDGDYTTSKLIRLKIEDAGYREALRILGAATGTFAVPVSERLILVAQDTTRKRQELEHNMAVVIPIPETVSVQEAQELARAIQQLMEIKRLVIDTQRRLVLVRDRVSRVLPAQVLFAELMRPRPEVTIEVDFLEATETAKTRYGLGLPGSFPLAWLSTLWGNSPAAPSGFSSLATLGGGASLIGLGIANAELFASMAHSSSRTLFASQLRAVDGQQAVLHVGDQYPVQTQGYFGPIEGEGQVFTPPPTISFEDLGIVVKVTPHVHGEQGITLEIETELKVLTGQTLNGIPVISNRSFQGVARLRDNEWAVVAGLARSSEVRAISGLAGLSQIPYLGALFRRDTREHEAGQALLVLKPRLVRLPAEGKLTRPVWTGTETRPLAPL